MSGIAVEVVIVQTRGTAAIYQADGNALRLKDVLREQPGPADFAECARVVDEHGDALRALVLRSAPLAPRTRLAVRPLALLYPRFGESPVLVGVPSVDRYAPTFDDRGPLRTELERLAQAGDGVRFAQTVPRWEDAAAATAFVQEGAARASVLRSGRRAVDVWRRADGATGEGAEAQVGRLPARFQEFVRELLVAGERIHFFAARPERLSRLPFARSIGEALLVVTDRQLLAIEDERPRSVDIGWWGYDARSIPLERILSAGVTAAGLSARSEAGGVALSIQLPREVQPVIDEIVSFVAGFARRDGALPMRRYEIEARSQPLLVPEGWPDARPIGEALLAQLERELGSAPHIAAYVKPARRGKDREGVLALYPTELVFAPLAATIRPTRVALATIAWVELRRSIFTSHLRIVGGVDERWPSASPAPLVPFFTALRQLIANPARCRG